MDDVLIRAPREEEFHAIWEIACAAFCAQPSQEDEETHRVGFPFERALCAYEDGRMVATSAVYSQELTVPGHAAVPMGGITWIATLPTHRRRGLMQQLVAASLADMVERGETVSGLGASEGSIYGRFGYGPATSVVSFSVDRPYADFSSPSDDPGGCSLRLLDPSEAASRLPGVYESVRLSQPGSVSRPAVWWNGHMADPPGDRGGFSRMLHVAHETVPGAPDGYVSYGFKEEWDAPNSVKVLELVTANPCAYRALWHYILNTDLCETAICGRGRVDEPLRWLLADPRRFRVNALSDFLWLRLLDIPRALAARSYRMEDDLVLEVCESFPSPRVSRLLLCTGPADAPGAECVPTTRAADLSLEIGVLAAAYLGGASWATLAAAGRVRELQAGAIKRADAVFATDTAPYCATEF
jgi:predicted acetyltransferase